ncbi:MAG: hypothetical protein CL678_15790 [Bdellovibrionaceae bacterium]|nr:hypothetical protein [Pseudobdellovibrionaceae bacterium]|tara:strand:+ start:159 stop:602 length:444 start_codon:yes stop_codon:yes gene_type:complete
MDIEDIRLVVADIVDKRSRSSLDGEAIGEIGDFMISYAKTANPYSMSGRGDLEKLWNIIRGQDVVLHFVMMSTSELILRVGYVQFKRLVEDICAAYGSCVTSGNESVVDSTFTDRAMSSSELSKIMTANPWYAFIVLAETVMGPDEK